MGKHTHTFHRRLPDYMTEEIARYLVQKKKAAFGTLFDAVWVTLQQKGRAAMSEETAKLKVYEKLQNLVNRGLVDKTNKDYRTTDRLAKEYPAESKPEEIEISIKDLKLLKVTYGDDEGLVSLAFGKLLASTEGEGNLTVPVDTPSCCIADWEAEEIYGADHSWTDVIGLLQEQYDWKKKTLIIPTK